MKLIAVLWVLVGSQLVVGYSLNILDQKDEAISSIVEQICSHTSGPSKQISKISTVLQVAEHLRLVETDHKLAACKNLYLNSVSDLANLVTISSNNVCSQEKINAIQQFHRNYILKGSQRTGKAPRILVTFFMHYVNSVTEICSKETTAFLRAVKSSTKSDNEEVDKFFAELTRKAGVSYSSSLKYSDMFLIWSMIDLLPLQKHHKLEKYLFEGEKRVVMVAKNSGSLMKMQQFCHDKIKPLYSYSLLSTMKLIDMGYYPQDPAMLDQLNDNKEARRFYELTKVCETLLPVRLVEISTRAESDVVLLNRDEVETMGLGETQPEPEVKGQECSRCSMADVESPSTITNIDAVRVAKRIKSNIKSRKSAFSRLLKIFLKNAKTSLSGKIKRLFRGESPLELVDNVDENQLDMYQVSEEYDDDEPSTHLARSKRGVMNVIGHILSPIVLIIGFILYCVWADVTFFLLMPLGLLYFLFMWLAGIEYYEPGFFLISGFGVFDSQRL